MHCTPGPHPSPPNLTCPPLSNLLLLSQQCNPPHATLTPFALSLTDSSNFQSLAGPPTPNLCTLLLYSPGSQPVGFSLFYRPAKGWREVDRRAVRALWWLRQGHFRDCVVGAAQSNVGWWGLNLAMALSLLKNTMGS